VTAAIAPLEKEAMIKASAIAAGDPDKLSQLKAAVFAGNEQTVYSILQGSSGADKDRLLQITKDYAKYNLAKQTYGNLAKQKDHLIDTSNIALQTFETAGYALKLAKDGNGNYIFGGDKTRDKLFKDYLTAVDAVKKNVTGPLGSGIVDTEQLHTLRAMLVGQLQGFSGEQLKSLVNSSGIGLEDFDVSSAGGGVSAVKIADAILQISTRTQVPETAGEGALTGDGVIKTLDDHKTALNNVLQTIGEETDIMIEFIESRGGEVSSSAGTQSRH
jgi:hypothetical protein